MKLKNEWTGFLAGFIAVLFLFLFFASCSQLQTTWRIGSGEREVLQVINSREQLELADRVLVKTDDPKELLRLKTLIGMVVSPYYFLDVKKRMQGVEMCERKAVNSGENPEFYRPYGVIFLANKFFPLCMTTEPYSFKKAELFCRIELRRKLLVNRPLTNTVVCGEKIIPGRKVFTEEREMGFNGILAVVKAFVEVFGGDDESENN